MGFPGTDTTWARRHPLAEPRGLVPLPSVVDIPLLYRDVELPDLHLLGWPSISPHLRYLASSALRFAVEMCA